MPKSKHSPEFRPKVSQEYLDGIGSIQFLSDKYSIGYSTLKAWINEYQIHGIAAFVIHRIEIELIQRSLNSDA